MALLHVAGQGLVLWVRLQGVNQGEDLHEGQSHRRQWRRHYLETEAHYDKLQRYSMAFSQELGLKFINLNMAI